MKHMDINTLTDQQTEVIKNHAGLTAYALHHGAPAHVCDIQPGNGTRYVVVVTAMAHATGNKDHISGEYVLSLPYFQTAYPTSFPGYTTPGYASEKWTRGNMADAEVISVYMSEIGTALHAAATASNDDY